MSVLGITKTILVTTLVEAIKKDLEEGISINTGSKTPFGKHVCAWITDIAKQIN